MTGDASADDSRRLFYDTIADRFETLDHRHDVERRLSIVFKELTSAGDLNGKLLLDAGCGYGAFSAGAARVGARIISADIATGLVHATIRKTGSRGVAADVLVMPFRSHSFHVVISSEVIEHTDRPADALGEFARVLKPGSRLIVTTPNRLWQSPVGGRVVCGCGRFGAWKISFGGRKSSRRFSVSGSRSSDTSVSTGGHSTSDCRRFRPEWTGCSAVARGRR